MPFDFSDVSHSVLVNRDDRRVSLVLVVGTTVHDIDLSPRKFREIAVDVLAACASLED